MRFCGQQIYPIPVDHLFVSFEALVYVVILSAKTPLKNFHCLARKLKTALVSQWVCHCYQDQALSKATSKSLYGNPTLVRLRTWGWWKRNRRTTRSIWNSESSFWHLKRANGFLCQYLVRIYETVHVSFLSAVSSNQNKRVSLQLGSFVYADCLSTYPRLQVLLFSIC